MPLNNLHRDWKNWWKW